MARSATSARTLWQARSKKERAILVWSVAGVAAVVAIAVGITLMPPAPIPTGTVTIDAVPWATVTRIEAQDGTAQPLPSPASTPLFLTLPAGTYRITLVGPPPDLESRVGTVEVQANGAAVLGTERFRTMTPDEYFEQYLTTAAAAPVDPASSVDGAPPQADPAGVQSLTGPTTAPPQGAPQ